MGVQSHYQTLKVPRTATHEEIRRAYHNEARRWHPDRFVSRSDKDREAADEAMRQVNEAWRVLGDPSRRQQFDQSLDEKTRGAAAGPVHRVSTTGGVTRIDPRLLDPEFLHQRRVAQLADREATHSAVLRYVPWVGILGLLVAIFIFTAYQGQNPSTPAPTTLAGPDVGVPANACVRIVQGPQLLEVPCEGVSDGRVVGAYIPGGSCPVGTVREVPLNDELTVCLA